MSNDSKGFRSGKFSSLLNRVLAGVLLSFLLPVFVYAQSVAEEPQLVMEETNRRLVRAFIDNSEAIRKDPQIANQLINQHLLPKINFELMSRYVLGKNWKKATPAQQQEFIIQFRELLIKFYSRSLLQYLESNDVNEKTITFKPFRSSKQNSQYATVRSLVHPPEGGAPVQVNYDLYQSKNTGLWQVYDVTIEGISMVANYRTSFNDTIAKNGMDGLIKELKDKVKSLDHSDHMVDKKA